MRLTASDIEGLLPTAEFVGRPEDARLDYKGGLPAPWILKANGWEAKHECAKDVSALANHLGGYIIVGIEEDRTTDPPRSLPGKLTGVGGADPEKQVKDWLHAALRPRELARRVEVYALSVRNQTVLVVDVPVWGDGIALVEWGSTNDRLGYFAAIRDGDHTRYLDHREMEERMNRRLRAEIAKLQAAGDVDLSVIDLQADEQGRVRLPVRQTRLEPEKRMPPGFEMFAPVRLDGVVGARRADVEAYLDRKSRAGLVNLLVENRGSARATDVEVRIDISNADDVDTALREPTRFPISMPAAVDPDRNGTRNVTLESKQLFQDDGSARVIQRIKVIAPGSDAELVPFYVIAGGETELSLKVEVEVIDSAGKRGKATFEYTLVREGDDVVAIDEFR